MAKLQRLDENIGPAGGKGDLIIRGWCYVDLGRVLQRKTDACKANTENEDLYDDVGTTERKCSSAEAEIFEKAPIRTPATKELMTNFFQGTIIHQRTTQGSRSFHIRTDLFARSSQGRTGRSVRMSTMNIPTEFRNSTSRSWRSTRSRSLSLFSQFMILWIGL